MSNIPTIQTLFQHFASGDVPGILDLLADDVAWEDWAVDHSGQKAGLPLVEARKGKEGAAAFFGVLAGVTFHDFQVRNLMEGGGHVVADTLVDLTTPGGNRLSDEELILFGFNDEGKVNRVRHYLDTARYIASWA